jgi:Niemann-Pick C1 protein
MHGICGTRKDGGALSCSNNTLAPAPTSLLAEKLQKTCPTLWDDIGGQQGRYCCTPEQVDKIASDVSLSAFWLPPCLRHGLLPP